MKSFNSLCSVKRCFIVLKTLLVITNPIFYQWNEKIMLDFNGQMSLDCLGNDYNLTRSFNWHASLYRKWLDKLSCFTQAYIFICFVWSKPYKMYILITLANEDFWFHSIVNKPWLFQFFPLYSHFIFFGYWFPFRLNEKNSWYEFWVHSKWKS